MNQDPVKEPAPGSPALDVSHMCENERRLETLIMRGEPLDVPSAAAVVSADEIRRIHQDQRRLARRLDPVHGVYARAPA